MPATNILSYFRKRPRLHAPNSDPIPESDSNNRSSSNNNNSSQPDSSYLPNDIGSKESGPAQPIFPVYPRDANITNPRYCKSFQKTWYQKHKWVIYSISNDKAYCHCCIHFSTHALGHQELAFTKEGFRNWSKAVGDQRKGLDKHARSAHHLQAEILWNNYHCNTVSIDDRLVPHRAQLIETNRKYFRIFLQYIRYFVLQEIPYRHLHEHDEDALNQGNFVELLKIICETNPVFEDLRSSVMKQYSIHQDYWSKTIFNEFVEAMADEVRTQIGKSIAEAGMFFLVIDECKDKAGHEQLSLCVRYSVGSTAKERFIGLVRLSENLSAAAIAEKILPLLSALRGDSVFLGLTTDGASVLFGVHSGVATRLRKVYGWIVNIHCTAHRLNLIVGQVVSQVLPSTLEVMKSLHSCFNALKTADTFEKLQKERNEKVRKVPGYIEVRWSSLFELTRTVVDRYQSILMTLAERSNDTDNQGIVCAGIYHKMANSAFVKDLLVFYKVIALLQTLSKLLQERFINWHQACAEIRSTRKALTYLEENPSFVSSLVDSIKKTCEECAIPLNTNSALYQTRSQSDELLEGDGNVQMHVQVQDTLKKVAQAVGSFFDQRYPTDNMKLLEGLDALDPCSDHYMSFEGVKPLIDRFGEALNFCETEVEMEMLKFNSGSGLADINNVSSPCIMRLMQLRNTIAVSSAEAERSFSCMNRIKSRVRRLLSDERTSDLTLLSFEADITKSLDLDTIISSFSAQKTRRVPL